MFLNNSYNSNNSNNSNNDKPNVIIPDKDFIELGSGPKDELMNKCFVSTEDSHHNKRYCCLYCSHSFSGSMTTCFYHLSDVKNNYVSKCMKVDNKLKLYISKGIRDDEKIKNEIKAKKAKLDEHSIYGNFIYFNNDLNTIFNIYCTLLFTLK